MGITLLIMENYGKDHRVVFFNFCGNPELVNSLPTRYFFFIFCCLLIFEKNQLFQKNLSDRKTISVSNSFSPDQSWHYVRPDLGPNCLERLLEDYKFCH